MMPSALKHTPRPEPVPSKPAWGLSRSYLAPAAAGVVVLALLVAWGVNEWFEIQRWRTDMLQRFGEGFAMFFDASIHQGDGAIEDPERAQSLLHVLADRAPSMRSAAFEVDGKVVAAVGDPLPELRMNTIEGEVQVGQQLVVWRRIRRTATEELRLPPPRVERNGPPPLVRRASDATSPLVIVALDMDSTSGFTDQRVRSMLAKGALALLAIIFMIGAWAQGIRNRRFAADLALERTRLNHLEELRFAAAGLAHETKNPLGLIRGLAQRIEAREGVDPTSARLAEQIIDAADRAAERLGEFLHFARLGAPKLADVDGEKLLGDILEILQYDFDGAQVKLVTHIQPARLKADEEMLRQVVVNLLLNSLTASSPGDTVTVDLDASNSAVALRVRDEGCGIPADLVEHVFKPYVTGTESGNGLGLAIVQRVADEHGWTIDLQTAPNAGTTITIAGLLRADPGSEARSNA